MEKLKKFVTSKAFVNTVMWLIAIALVVMTVWFVAHFWRYFSSFGDERSRDALKDAILEYRPFDMLILLAIQIVQVVIAIIPGGPIEVVAGLIYGTFGGAALVLAGTILGSMSVFSLVRFFGHKLVERVFASEKLSKFKFLSDTKRLEIIIFILFFIPGLPKDMLTYIAPLTKIKQRDFLIITTIARIPAVVSSTYIGSALDDGKFLNSVIMLTVIGVLGILGILLHNKWLDKKGKTSGK